MKKFNEVKKICDSYDVPFYTSDQAIRYDMTKNDMTKFEAVKTEIKTEITRLENSLLNRLFRINEDKIQSIGMVKQLINETIRVNQDSKLKQEFLNI